MNYYCEILLLNILVLCGKVMLTNIMLEQCISRRLQRNPKDIEQINPEHIRKLRDTLKELQLFSNLYREALYRSPSENGLESKRSTQEKLLNALSEFTSETCKCVERDSWKVILSHVALLEKEARIQIVTYAIRARASFTTPTLPMLVVNRDCNQYNKLCTMDSTIIVNITGTHRMESYLSSLSDIRRHVDEFIAKDIHSEYEYLTTVVMRDVIERAHYLPYGEKMARLEQIASNENRDKMTEQLAEFARKCGLVFETKRPIGPFLRGAEYLYIVTEFYLGIKWQTIGENIFKEVDDLFFMIHAPHFVLNEKFLAILKSNWANISVGVVQETMLEFSQAAAQAIFNEYEQYLFTSYRYYVDRIVKVLAGQSKLKDDLAHYQYCYLQKSHKIFLTLIKNQSSKIRSGQKTLFAEAAKNPDFSAFHQNTHNYGMIMWRGIHSVARLTLKMFEQRSDVLLSVAQKYHVTNEEHIPAGFFPVTFSFIIARLIQIRDSHHTAEEIEVNAREYILAQENMVINVVRGQFEKMEHDLWHWLQGTYLPKQGSAPKVVKIEKARPKKSVVFAKTPKEEEEEAAAAAAAEEEEEDSDEMIGLFSMRGFNAAENDDFGHDMFLDDDDVERKSSHLELTRQPSRGNRDRESYRGNHDRETSRGRRHIQDDRNHHSGHARDGESEHFGRKSSHGRLDRKPVHTDLRHSANIDDDNNDENNDEPLITAFSNMETMVPEKAPASSEEQHPPPPPKERKSSLRVKTVADSLAQNVHPTHVASFLFSDLKEQIKNKRNVILRRYDMTKYLHSRDLFVYIDLQRVFDDYAQAINNLLFKWNGILYNQVLSLPSIEINDNQINPKIDKKPSVSAVEVKQSDTTTDANANDKHNADSLAEVRQSETASDAQPTNNLSVEEKPSNTAVDVE